ncbi:MAG: hypothetical protein ACTSYR_05300 [Candidatus Odinarchaeia archaeon]
MDAERLKYLNYLFFSIKDRIRLLSARRLFYPQPLKIEELDGEEWECLLKDHKEMRSKAVIQFQDNKIFLKKGYWCVKDLVHQILHILSPITQISKPNTISHSFTEALTEMLTGYFLMRFEKNCYETWRTNRKCKVEHCKDVKAVYFLTLKIGLAQVFDIYFTNQIKSINQIVKILNNRFNQLLETKLKSDEPILLQLTKKLTSKIKEEYHLWLKTQTPFINLKQIKSILY